MHVRRRARAALTLTALLLSGCASRARFVYPHIPGTGEPGTLIGGLHDVCDRLADREMAEFYEENIPTAITGALKGEMEASGAFSSIKSLPGCVATPPLETLRDRGIAIVVQPQIDRLQWVVPDYSQILGTTVVVSLLFGMVGGIAYGMTDTEVYGHVELHMVLLDVRTGKSVERVYTGEAHEAMDKMACDTPETRRKMVGRAFDDAMEGFRADLKAMAASTPTQTAAEP